MFEKHPWTWKSDILSNDTGRWLPGLSISGTFIENELMKTGLKKILNALLKVGCSF